MPQPRILRSLAANPNTPPPVLAKMAEFCPDHFLRNPIVPLLPLEHPGFYGLLSTRGALQLAARRAASPALLARLSASADPVENATAQTHIANAGEADPEGDEWRDALRAERDALPLAELPPGMRQHMPNNPAQRTQMLLGMAHSDGPYGLGSLFEMIALGITPRWVEKRLREEEPELVPLLDRTIRMPALDPLAVTAAAPDTAPETLWNCYTEVEKRFEGEVQAYMAERGVPYRAGGPHHHLPDTIMPRPAQVRKGYVYSDRKQQVMGALLENPATPPALLRTIVRKFPTEPFIEMVVQHPALPPSAVEWLPLRSSEIRCRIRERRWAKKKVVRDALRQAVLQGVLHHVGQEDRLSGFLALRYDDFPLHQWHRIALTGLRMTRAAILLNPRAPVVLRRRLVEREGDRYLRAAGLARLAHPSRDFGL
jgi:hypothetical protein